MEYLTDECGHHCGAITLTGTNIVVRHCYCDDCHGRESE